MGKAGTHLSADRVAQRWTPAFAGEAFDIVCHHERPCSLFGLYIANGAILGGASDSRDQRNVLIFPASVGSAFTLRPRQIGGVADWRHPEFDPAFTMGPMMRSRRSCNAAGSPASASSTASRSAPRPRRRAQPRSTVDVVAAAARPAGGIARPAPGEPPARVPRPVPPVLSGRDQASATPSNRNLAPTDGLNARECRMRLW